MAWKIFTQAIRLVFSHLGVALRISALLYIIEILFLTAAAFLGLRSAMTMSFDAAAIAGTLITVVVFVAVTIWIAVGWHRFVLLDEMPGAVLPRFNGDRMLAYFGNSLLLGLVILGIWLVFGIVLMALSAAFHADAWTGFFIALVPLLVLFVAVLLVSYRLGVILPASAVGKPIRFADAWAATRGATGTLILLVILSVLGVIVLRLPEAILPEQLIWVRFAWDLVIGWVELIVGVSILTTLYGVYVEKRPLD